MQFIDSVTIIYPVDKDNVIKTLIEYTTEEDGDEKWITRAIGEIVTAAFRHSIMAGANTDAIAATINAEKQQFVIGINTLLGEEFPTEGEPNGLTGLIELIWAYFYLHGMLIYSLFRKQYPALLTYVVTKTIVAEYTEHYEIMLTVDKNRFDKELPKP